jgi:tRNA dimethylallyltransferase
MPQVLCLMGPTASGKSAAAAALAAAFPIEVISVDSALVYRGMDIGTAKPDASERARIPHHLIDILEPEESYSAARFAKDADACINAVFRRERVPLLVGGTMLYFKALAQGLNAMPPANASVRRALEDEANVLGWPRMHEELRRVDAITAARLDPNDAQRIQRALEVFRVSGVPLSQLHEGKRGRASPWRFVNVALEPLDRARLHQQIEKRFDAMLEAGFLKEVARLMQRDALTRDVPSMRAVGYRQAWEHLAGETDIATMREKAIAATRQLAKHQLTWLRSIPDRISLDCFASDVVLQVEAAARKVLAPCG